MQNIMQNIKNKWNYDETTIRKHVNHVVDCLKTVRKYLYHMLDCLKNLEL